jgi:hypothetical protein
MHSKRWRYGIAVIVVVYSSGCIREEVRTDSAPAASSSATLPQALAASDSDAAVAALEQVKARGLKPEDVELVQNAWTTRDSLLQRLNSADERRAVEVAMADVLLQSRINGFRAQDDRTLTEMRNLLRSVAEEQRSHAALQAISALSTFDDDESVSLLARFARGKDDNKARAAIVGLAYMCHRDAERRLREVASELESRKAFALDQIKEGERFRRETRQCERRAVILKAN